MSTILDETRKRILSDIYFETKIITKEEYRKLPLEDRQKCEALKNEYVMKVPVDIPFEEEDKLINLKILAYLRESRDYLYTIKNIALFWLAITIIGIVAAIIVLK